MTSRMPGQLMVGGILLGFQATANLLQPRGLIPGARIRYVSNSGVPTGDGSSPDRPKSTLTSAVEELVAGGTSDLGDCIMMMPGHTETIDAADWLSELGALKGLSIGSFGTGSQRATLTWSAAASTLLMDTVNLELFNCNLRLAGAHAAGSALTVAAPMTVSAAGVRLIGNHIRWGFDVDQIVGDGIIWTGDQGVFAFNECIAPVAAVPSNTFLTLTGADDMVIVGNHIEGATDATARGVIDSETTACLNLTIAHNTIKNLLAASTIAVSLTAGDTGQAYNNRLFVNSGILPFTAGEMEWYENYVINGEGEAGALVGTPSA